MTYTTKDLVRDLGTGIVDPARLETIDPQLVRSIKADLPIHARTIAGCVRQMDKASRTVTYAATVEVVDRMGDLILTKPRAALGKPRGDGSADKGEGFLVESFVAAGAPFLWSHLSRDHAVGQVTKSAQRRIDTPRDGKVWATLQTVRYLTDERIPFAVPTWLLVEEGIAKAVSVGFVGALVWAPDEEASAKIGLKGWGVVFLTSDQTELSQAQTPANQLALAQKAAEDGGETERRSMAALERAIEEKREVGGVVMSKTLLADFLREFPLGPSAEQEILRTRLESVFDLGRVSGELLRLCDEDAELEPQQARENADGEERSSEPASESPAPPSTPGRETSAAPKGAKGEVPSSQSLERAEASSCPPGGSSSIPDNTCRYMTDSEALQRIGEALGLDERAASSGVEVWDAFERFRVEHSAERAAPAPLGVAERAALRSAFEAFSEGLETLAGLYEAVEDGRSLDDEDGAATVDDAFELAWALVDKIRAMPPAARAHLAPTLDGGRAADARAAAGEKRLTDFF